MPKVSRPNTYRSQKPYRSQIPYSRPKSTHEIESQLREKARLQILNKRIQDIQYQLVEKDKALIQQIMNEKRKQDQQYLDYLNSQYHNNIDWNIESFNFHPNSKSLYKADITPIKRNPAMALTTEGFTQDGIFGGVKGPEDMDCFIRSLEALKYGNILQRIIIAYYIDPHNGFLYNAVDPTMEIIGRQERLYIFKSWLNNTDGPLRNPVGITINLLSQIIENIADILMDNNEARMIVFFQASGSGHYTIIQKKYDKIRIIEPQPGNSCGIPKTVKKYLEDENMRKIINIGFLMLTEEAELLNKYIVNNELMHLINYRESIAMTPVARGIKKTRRKKNKDKQVKSKQVKSKQEKSRKLRVKKVKSRKLKDKKNKRSRKN